MLSDREREVLRELERQIKAEDPEFVNSFDARPQGAGRKLVKVLVVTAIVIAAALGALAVLVTGSFGVLVALGIVAGLGWLSWLSFKKSKGTKGPSS